jgi:hypothetical protein
VEQSGTADRSYGVAGAFAKVKQRFKRIHGPGGLNERMISYAEKHGYVETMPDKTVDPKRGYLLYCSRTSDGRILPTVPLNYHVQGTACWWMMKAMIRCYNYLQTLGPEYWIIMQVHDELVFDFPAGKNGNLDKINRLKQLMEQGGDDLGLPTPVKVEYHPHNWSESEHVTGKPKAESKGYNSSPVATRPVPQKPKLKLHKYQVSILQYLSKSARPIPGMRLSQKLKISSANITGFAGPQSAAQVETEWPFPALDSLGYVTVEVHDVNGRDVRLYTITPCGRKYLK